MDKFSVCIASNNRIHQLKRALNSIAAQKIKPTEVVIIDTSDKSIKKDIQAFERLLNITYIYRKGLNIPQARNACIKGAKYDKILLIDDDCEAKSNWTEKLLALSKKYPNAALISGSFVHLPKKSIFSIIIDEMRSQRLMLSKDHDNIYINIGNSFVDRSKISKMKIKFDLKMRREEDIDFAIKILSKGLTVLCLEEPKVFHYSRPNLLRFLIQRFQNGGNSIRLKRNWGSYDFFFFGSKSFSYLSVYLKITKKFIKQKQVIQVIKLTIVTLLATIFYLLGYINSLITNPKRLQFPSKRLQRS